MGCSNASQVAANAARAALRLGIAGEHHNPFVAVAMWGHGLDTADISAALRVRESFVYAHLPRWREAMREVLRKLQKD